MSPLEIFSEFLGWVFVSLWSSVWIPQTITNFRTRNVSGVSSQFLLLNMIGYLYYAIFVWGGTFYQYKHNMESTILIQDRCFASAASFVIYTMAVQTFILWPKTRSDTFSMPVILIATILIVLGIYNLLLGMGHMLPWWSNKGGAFSFSVLHYFGLAKSFCSLVKQAPQVHLNYRRKHTVGHNMMGPCFDLIGGVCSLIQMLIKAYLGRSEDGSWNWTYFHNIPKVFLSMESIFFDTVFLSQAFIFYRSNNIRVRSEMEAAAAKNELKEALISDVTLDNLNDDTTIQFHQDSSQTLDGLGMAGDQPKSLNNGRSKRGGAPDSDSALLTNSSHSNYHATGDSAQ